jgi:hypothetical protein
MPARPVPGPRGTDQRPLPPRLRRRRGGGARGGGGGGAELGEGGLGAVEVEGLALELHAEVLPLPQQLRLVAQQRRHLPRPARPAAPP